jgi:hypothetical protein
MTRPDPSLPQQTSVRSFLRIGGAVIAVIGLILTVGGLIDFFSAFGSFEPPRNFWMAFIGLPLMMVGGAMLKAGYLGPATRYVAGEVTPVLRDTLGALGIGEQQRACERCGAGNDADASFCDACGRALGG